MMKRFTLALIVLLFFLHQDFWLWDSQRIVWGVLPIGLVYHLAFSVAAAVVWAIATKTLWPSRWEAWAQDSDPRDS